MEFVGKDAVNYILSLYPNEPNIVDFAKPILEFYEPHLIARFEPGLPNSRLDINHTENLAKLGITEIIFRLKNNDRMKISVIHELLHLQLRMQLIAVEVGVGERNGLNPDPMGMIINHFEHILMLPIFISLGFKTEQFVTAGYCFDEDRLKSRYDILCQYLTELAVERYFEPNVNHTSNKERLQYLLTDLSGRDESLTFQELARMDESFNPQNPKDYAKDVNSIYILFGHPSLTNYISLSNSRQLESHSIM